MKKNDVKEGPNRRGGLLDQLIDSGLYVQVYMLCTLFSLFHYIDDLESGEGKRGGGDCWDPVRSLALAYFSFVFDWHSKSNVLACACSSWPRMKDQYNILRASRRYWQKRLGSYLAPVLPTTCSRTRSSSLAPVPDCFARVSFLPSRYETNVITKLPGAHQSQCVLYFNARIVYVEHQRWGPRR